MAAWAQAPYFSHQNKRAGIVNGQEPQEEARTYTAEELAERNLNQPPYYLILSRKGPMSTELSNVYTNEVIYTIRETGRGSLSGKPDYEIYRKKNDLFVGSIRFGKRGVEVKFPITNKKVSEIETFTTAKQDKLKWETKRIRSKNNVSAAKATAEAAQAGNGGPNWCVILECSGGSKTDDGKICGVKLIDILPNGRFEVFDKEACVDVGGDWGLLDEIVTISYANMEKARRKCLGASDPTSVGMGGIGMVCIGG